MTGLLLKQQGQLCHVCENPFGRVRREHVWCVLLHRCCFSRTRTTTATRSSTHLLLLVVAGMTLCCAACGHQQQQHSCQHQEQVGLCGRHVCVVEGVGCALHCSGCASVSFYHTSLLCLSPSWFHHCWPVCTQHDSPFVCVRVCLYPRCVHSGCDAQL